MTLRGLPGRRGRRKLTHLSQAPQGSTVVASLPVACQLPAPGNEKPASSGQDAMRRWGFWTHTGCSKQAFQTWGPEPSPPQLASHRCPCCCLSLPLARHIPEPCRPVLCTILAFELLGHPPGSPQASFCGLSPSEDDLDQQKQWRDTSFLKLWPASWSEAKANSNNQDHKTKEKAKKNPPFHTTQKHHGESPG